MAGSFGHCNKDDGSFTFDLIDNMGDAHEACEMMHFMIHYLADGFDRTKDPKEIIKQAEEAYYRKTYGEK